MEKETKQKYCLFMSGEILDDRSESCGRVHRPVYKVQAKIIRLSEEERVDDAKIEALLSERPPEDIAVIMSSDPDFFKNTLYRIENEHGEWSLYPVLNLKGILY